MRVLLWMPDAAGIPGGHRVQMDQTASHLRKMGIDVEVQLEPQAEVERFDLVHCFGEPLEGLRRCRQAGVLSVVSSIYWARSYTSGQDRTYSTRSEAARSLGHRLRGGAGLLRAALQNRASEACEARNERLIHLRVAYEMADLLLPNSRLEAEAVVRELKLTTPCHITPNAVDPTLFTPPTGFSWDRWEPSRQGVLYAGRFEHHKNQLGLIRAWKPGLPPLTLVGKPHPHHPDYYARCQAEAARRGIKILSGVPHEELPDLYRQARVHILPSWFETTGLVSLEAALCGCNLAMTNRGFVREYFGDHAFYFDPSDPAQMVRAAQEAHAAPPRPQMRDWILSYYTWEHTARATLEGYRRLWAGREQARLRAQERAEQSPIAALLEDDAGISAADLAAASGPQISGVLRPGA